MTNELPLYWLEEIDRRVTKIRKIDPFASRSSVIRHWIAEKLVDLRDLPKTDLPKTED